MGRARASAAGRAGGSKRRPVYGDPASRGPQPRRDTRRRRGGAPDDAPRDPVYRAASPVRVGTPAIARPPGQRLAAWLAHWQLLAAGTALLIAGVRRHGPLARRPVAVSLAQPIRAASASPADRRARRDPASPCHRSTRCRSWTRTRPGPCSRVRSWLPALLDRGSRRAFDPATDPYLRGSAACTDLVLFSVGMRRDGSLRLDTPGARFVLGPAATRDHRGRARAGHPGAGVVHLVLGARATGRPVRRPRGDGPVRDGRRPRWSRLRGFDGADLDVELIKKVRVRRLRPHRGPAQGRRCALDNPLARVTVATNGDRSGARMAKRRYRGRRRSCVPDGLRLPRSDAPARSARSRPSRASDRLDLRESLATVSGERGAAGPGDRGAARRTA